MRVVFIKTAAVCAALIFWNIFFAAEQAEDAGFEIQEEQLMDAGEDAEFEDVSPPEPDAESLEESGDASPERRMLSPYEFALSRAESGQAPVMAYDPGTESAAGYILWEDLDGDGAQEAVIPYT
ncbi:MAG TPA: hypothetical protein ENN55_05160, partial [Firmicutes bacterium]|nr:hypothetical protein [Bacillota bacterium]